MAQNTLQDIQTKVRRLTRSPSEAQLSTADINNYVNTFILYDFPEHLRTFNLRQVFEFWCSPNIDVYKTDTSLPLIDPLYDFQNRYIIVIGTPVYIAGFQSFYTQSREQFFGIYPFVNSIMSIGVEGNGVTQFYSGIIGSLGGPPSTNIAPLLQNNVLFSSVDINNNGLALIDVPLNARQGNLIVPNNGLTGGGSPLGLINYITGQFSFTFPTPPQAGAAINSQTVPYVASRPQALLYYQNQFTLRPVPDQPYAINFEVYKRPSELLASNQHPELDQWWQYIAYGAAKKVFEDRLDIDSVQLIMPEFKKQEILVNRTTIVQYTNERTATIYTEQTNFGAGTGAWGWGGGPF